MKRILKRLLAVSLAIVLLLAVAAWVILSFVLVRPTVYEPQFDPGPIALRSWPEHDRIYQQARFPYVLSIRSRDGALEYVGCQHTTDAANPQLKEMEQRWKRFEPTVALCEGRERMSRFASRRESGKLLESQLVRILAYKNGVTLYTLEPAYETEVAGLLKHFDAKLVAVYMTLRVYTAESDKSGQQDDLALALMRKRTDVDGLRNTFQSLEDFDRFWQQQFPEGSNWRSLPDTEQFPLLVEVGNVSRQVRGEHMIRSIVELVNHGERVFAVVGASHVIRQEPFLREMLEN